MRTLPALTLLIGSLLTLSGCGGLDLKSADPAPEPVNTPDEGADSDLDDATGATPGPGAARMVRLTQQQYRNAALDLTGWAPSSPLPVDYDLHGYITVGAGEVSVAPFDLELYEAAAWELAEAMVPADSAVDGVLGCALQIDSLDDLLGGDTGGGPDIDETCVRSWTAGLVAEAWRRPAVSSKWTPSWTSSWRSTTSPGPRWPPVPSWPPPSSAPTSCFEWSWVPPTKMTPWGTASPTGSWPAAWPSS